MNYSRLKHNLLFTILVLGFLHPGLRAQTITGPNQCLPTPTFSAGTAGLMCPDKYVLDATYTETFDQSYGGFSRDPLDGRSNQIRRSFQGTSPINGSGPQTTASCSGTTNLGEFVYLFGPFVREDESHCMSTNINLTEYESGPLALSFWYHMYGNNIGELSVKINDVPDFSIAGEQQTENGQPWRQAILNLDRHAGNTINLQVCMTTGDGSLSSDKSFIAVDQFQVYRCVPEGFDLLTYMPAILAGVEKRPPPPPPPARWRITNTVVCPATFHSDWTVSDGETTRKSYVSGYFDDEDTSGYVTVEPGIRTFRGTLRTSTVIGTCGTFNNDFTKDLKPGHDYRFILRPNSAGTGTTVLTVISER